jgi:hypothetical protein
MTDMNPGSLVAAGGWSIPKDQIPGWPFDRLLVPIRGGMKYPTPTERTHTMANENEEFLSEMLDMRAKLDEKIRDMQKILRKQRYPKVPSKADGNMFGVNVKFSPTGKVYRFLLLRTPNGWYTTGTDQRNAHFETWTKLIDWLRGPDVYWHGALFTLIESGASVLEAERNG